MRAALLAAAVGLAALAGCAGPPAEEPAGRFYGVQLHLHGPLSEGSGTMRGQNLEARELGTLDVLWWTEHDWRIARHTFPEGFGFEAETARLPIPHRGAPWSKRPRRIRVGWEVEEGGEGRARLAEQATEGEHSLELRAPVSVRLAASGGRFSAPLAAEVTLHLAVQPRELPAGSAFVVDLELSRQQTGISRLSYRFVSEGEPVATRRAEDGPGGRTGTVTGRVEPRRWNRLALPVSADAEALALGGGDNSLRRIRLKVEPAPGTAAVVLVDDLRIEAPRAGQALLDWQREQARRLGEELGQVNHVGLEVSYGMHLNAYFPGMEVPDFGRHPHGLSAQEIVAWARSRGGMTSYDHVFGAGDEEPARGEAEAAERRRLVLDNAAYGADLLEVGYPQRVRPLPEHLAVWDALSSQRVVVTGLGTNDSHSQGEGWRGGNNFATWVWARGTEQEALIEGFRRGRAFFGDPARFEGRLEIFAGEAPMGSVVVTPRAEHAVRLEAAELPAGSTLRWVVDGEVVAERPAAAGSFGDTLDLETNRYRFVRAELWQGRRPLAFTNPLYFVPAAEGWEEPAHQAGRLVVDRGGGESESARCGRASKLAFPHPIRPRSDILGPSSLTAAADLDRPQSRDQILMQ